MITKQIKLTFPNSKLIFPGVGQAQCLYGSRIDIAIGRENIHMLNFWEFRFDLLYLSSTLSKSVSSSFLILIILFIY